MIKITKCYKVLQTLLFLWGSSAFAASPELWEDVEGKGLCATVDLRIPAGKVEDSLLYVDIPMGTPVAEVPAQIAQKRELSGLSRMIPLKDQAALDAVPWQMPQLEAFKAGGPAKLINVWARKGQEVKRGERLCELECMKMFTLYASYLTGKVVYALQEGENVEKETVLFLLAPLVPTWTDIDPPDPSHKKGPFSSLYPWEPPSEAIDSVDSDENVGEEGTASHLRGGGSCLPRSQSNKRIVLTTASASISFQGWHASLC